MLCLLNPLTNSRLMNAYPTSKGLVDSDLSAEFLVWFIAPETVDPLGTRQLLISHSGAGPVLLISAKLTASDTDALQL